MEGWRTVSRRYATPPPFPSPAAGQEVPTAFSKPLWVARLHAHAVSRFTWGDTSLLGSAVSCAGGCRGHKSSGRN